MAEGSADIQKLIKLRKQRPAFSRMISWEISQAAEQHPVKKIKQKKKKECSDTNDENKETEDQVLGEDDSPDFEISDSSEYETACEDEDSIESRTEELSINDSESQFESIGTDSLELDDGDNEVDDDNVEEDEDIFMSSVGSDKILDVGTSGEPQSGRRRRLSKKQKRKRKKYFRMMYVDDLYNLGNLFDVTDEINDVFSEVLASDPNVEVKHRVPTLVELCMRANRKKPRTNSERQRNVSGADKDRHRNVSGTDRNTATAVDLPYRMKKLISSWGRDQKQIENQLSFFLNKVLPIVEEKVLKKHYMCADHMVYYSGKIHKVTFQKRSVWSVLPFPPSKNILSQVSYASEKSPAFLFTPSMHSHEEVDNLYYSYNEHFKYDNVTLTNAMWALATTVDLMLPQQTNTTSIIRVKRALNLRYKCLVETLFEYVLPYVMWARGKVAMATDVFRNLVEKETEVDAKAMFLSEIGRMHAMFRDAATAEQFYRIATETALEDLNAERRDKCINEVSEQKQILLASIYDTGVLDIGKAVQSCTYWSGVKNLPTVRNSTITAGCDALLCYHLSHCSDSNPYEEAISRLEKMTKSCTYVYYYQSMLHALQGSTDVSTRLYRECRMSCFHTPGDAVLSLLEKRARTPWKPIIDLVNMQRLKVKPLKVIWRTNLQAPRVSKHRPMEAQVNSYNLNLHQNEAGYITGDMQMALPPLRDISLDPFNGSLVIDNIPSHTGTWMSAFLASEYTHCGSLVVPTPMLIYSGEDSTTVHMVNPSNTSSGLRTVAYFNYNGPPCPFMLYWTGPDGQMAKLNLLSVYKNHCKKMVTEQLNKNHDHYFKTTKFNDTEYQMLFKFLDVAYDKNYTLTEPNIVAAVTNYKSTRQKVKKLEDKGKKVPKHLTRKSLVSCFNQNKNSMYEKCELVDEPYVFGKSIALELEGSRKCLVIINTEDKSSFLSSGLHEPSLVIRQGRNNCTSEEYLMLVRNKDVLLLNQKGETLLQIEDNSICVAARDRCRPAVVYPNIYGINKEKNSIWRVVLGLEDVILDVQEYICWTVGSIYDELAQGTQKEPLLYQLTPIGEKAETTGKLLMVNLVCGLGFIDPATVEFVPVHVTEGCAQHFEFTSGNELIKGDFENVEVLAEKTFMEDNKAVCRLAFGIQNKVFMLDLSRSVGEETSNLEMICSLELPGLVKEVCLVGKQVGMLISLTQHRDVEEEYYREHVFFFDFSGHLHGVLLCLGRGPRSFFPIYLHGNNGSDESQSEENFPAGWYVYLRDGRDGIMCVRLQ